MVPLMMCSSRTGIFVEYMLILFVNQTIFNDVLFSFYVYRVASDSNHAQMVYDQLTGNTMISFLLWLFIYYSINFVYVAAGFKVYLDKVCIRAGHFWEEE